ncbi:hypothetical protein ACFFRR_004910 [Megaselia abdita]
MNSTKVAFLFLFVKLLFLCSFVSADYCSGDFNLRKITKELRVFNCSVIYGSIKILYTSIDDRKYLKFPNLREIRDYLILSEVADVDDIGEIFPNLAIIRGQKLFLNYAFVVHRMNDLQNLNLKNLVAIQRGTILISENKKLCYVNKINWDRISLSPGKNHIFPIAKCPNVCNGCDYCWSNKYCQKFENDNLLRPHKECHENCISGCIDLTDTTCNVCRKYKLKDRCVAECPPDYYLSRDKLQCVTKEECVKAKKYLHGSECVWRCPYGFTVNAKDGICKKCETPCASDICALEEPIVQHISDIEHLQGCSHLNSSLILKFVSDVDIKDLERFLGSLKRIEGYLKIYRSRYFKSLHFLENLEYISGAGKEQNQYSLIIYDNRRLKDLWKIKKSLKIGMGGIYIEKNWRLCTNIAVNFSKAIDHDRRLDRIQKNDKEVLCYPVKLNLQLKFTHNSVIIVWERYQDADTVEILYKESNNETDSMDSCLIDEWQSRIEYIKNIESINKTFMRYTINSLKSNTRYEMVLKTFASLNSEIHSEAQSDVTYFKTMNGYPKPISWAKTTNKTASSLTIEWSLPESIDVRSYVHIQLIEQQFNKSEIDSRNYCKHRMNRGFKMFDGTAIEGCCNKMVEETQNRKFEEDISNLFECSLDNPNNCDLKENNQNIVVQEDVPSNENRFTFHHLRFALYIFKIFSCNDIGCSNFYYHSDMTLYNITNDAIKSSDITACRQGDQYEIELPAPIESEGIKTSFVLSFFDNLNAEEKPIRLCVTEKKHRKFKYRLKTSFENVTRILEELQIETFSIAGNHHDFKYVSIKDCNEFGDSVLISFMILAIVIVSLGCYIFRKRINNYIYSIWLKYKNPTPVDEEILMEEFETIHFSAY